MASEPKATRAARTTGMLVVFDNALYSLGTFLFGLAAARALTGVGFGRFSAVGWVVMVAAFCVRSAIMEPSGSRVADGVPLGRALGAGYCGSVIVGVAAMLPVRAVSSTWMEAALFGVVVTAIAAQDATRYVALFRDQVEVALVSDAVGVVVGGATLLFGDDLGVPQLVTAWGAAAVVGIVAAMPLLRIRPQVGAGIRSLVASRREVGHYLADTVVNYGSFVAGMSIAAASGGLAVAGALNGARMCITPAQILITGAGLHELSGVAAGRSAAPDRRRALRLITTAGIAAVVLGLPWLVLPIDVLRHLFGASAAGVHEALPGFVLASAGMTGVYTCKVVLKLWGSSVSVLRIGLASAPGFLALPVLGHSLADSAGAAAGVGVAACAALVAGVVLVRRANATPAPMDHEA